MIDVFAKTFMTATRTDDLSHRLTRVRDVKPTRRARWFKAPARYIDLNDL